MTVPVTGTGSKRDPLDINKFCVLVSCSDARRQFYNIVLFIFLDIATETSHAIVLLRTVDPSIATIQQLQHP